MTRRMTHTAHHRGQQLCLLRILGHEEYSDYGLTADTGGLMKTTRQPSTPTASLEAIFRKAKATWGSKKYAARSGAKAGY